MHPDLGIERHNPDHGLECHYPDNEIKIVPTEYKTAPVRTFLTNVNESPSTNPGHFNCMYRGKDDCLSPGLARFGLAGFTVAFDKTFALQLFFLLSFLFGLHVFDVTVGDEKCSMEEVRVFVFVL